MTTRALRVTQTAITIDAIPPGTASIDVCFDKRRVWSIDVSTEEIPTTDPVEFPWPPALQPYLTGQTRVSLIDSASHTELAACDVQFDDQPHHTSVTDAAGSQLMVNKWGRLGHSLEAMGAESQYRILEDASTIVKHLTDMGLRPFVVGGTLLGGVRESKLLPHDDDADIAYLSKHTNPADVTLEALRLGHRLTELGYQVLHHSAVHMQLSFPGAAIGSGSPATPGHYIDVFAAFFTNDGHINQPFHVRARMTETQMLPFGTVTIDGFEFPAPADVDHWLTINYNSNWRKPIPGFKIVTPLETRRRFEPWFGGFNFQREYWDDRFIAEDATDTEWQAGRDWLLAQPLSTPYIVDLGCGLGELTRQLAQQHPDHRVVGLDFSTVALDRATTLPLPNLSYGRLNLNRLQSIALTRRFSITGPFSLVANHLVEELGHHARANAWRIARMALRSGGSVCFTFNTLPAANVTIDDPSGWHLTREQITTEASRSGLSVVFTSLSERSDRDPTGVRVRLADPELTVDTSAHTASSSRRTNDAA